ncbi:uncharacterized protein AB675_7075 [Cyphellophora attinorum]|uniref:Uncharacterized protein n=1 Tax=Cyphellophora attinorum TaxID=1664694 RepID=A0A0N1H8K9_9EURO|nr:uncharacterized protein AB675_7075 [Phialophora attinorum]KPI43313.1 hypothetical protein AB675_7075 [Phialophora attinorum]
MAQNPATAIASTVREGPLGFLDLPPEIRLMIYKELLPCTVYISVFAENTVIPNWDDLYTQQTHDSVGCHECGRENHWCDDTTAFGLVQKAVRAGKPTRNIYQFSSNPFHAWADPQTDQPKRQPLPSTELPDHIWNLIFSCRTVYNEMRQVLHDQMWLRGDNWCTMADFGLMARASYRQYALTVKHMSLRPYHYPFMSSLRWRDRFWKINNDDWRSEMRWLPLLAELFSELEILKLEGCPLQDRTPGILTQLDPQHIRFVPEQLMAFKAVIVSSPKLAKVVLRISSSLGVDVTFLSSWPVEFEEDGTVKEDTSVTALKIAEELDGATPLDVDEGLQTYYDRNFNCGAACSDAVADLDPAGPDPQFRLDSWCGF